MYSCTKNVLRSAVIDSTIDVRQGSSSTCVLFVMYVDHMVRMLKRAIVTYGFLAVYILCY